MWPRHVLFAALLASASVQGAQDPLEAIKQLYTSADYEGTLAALDRFKGVLAPDRVTEIDRYRALCLIALGRTADADVVIERIVLADPRYEPSEDEAAPRVRAAFSTVRTRVLPGVVRGYYATGKAAYDRKDFANAVPAFEKALDVLGGLRADEAGMGDLRTLASGFLDLSRAALKPAPPPDPPKPAEPEPPVEKASPPPPEPPSDPVVIRQDLPLWNPAWSRSAALRTEFRGVVEVVIDEQGNVTAAKIVEPVHPLYDQQLLDAAKTWKYIPARRNGRPIAASKRVDVVLQPQ